MAIKTKSVEVIDLNKLPKKEPLGKKAINACHFCGGPMVIPMFANPGDAVDCIHCGRINQVL